MLDESLDEEEEESKFSCEHCKKEFPSKTFLIHISRKSDCKAFYGPRFEEMKKKKKHENVKRFRKKTDNQTEKVAKRKSYQVKKMNSDANLARYYEEIEFGPEFVCVCCHASLDGNQVLEFTEDRKEKIGHALFKTS